MVYTAPKYGMLWLTVMVGWITLSEARSIGRPTFLDEIPTIRDEDTIDDHIYGEHVDGFDHKFITGTYDQSGDAYSQEESKARLRTLLSQMDTDGNLFIGRREMTNWLIRSFRSLDAEDSLARLTQVDIDNNGQLSWHEYLWAAFRVPDTKNATLRDRYDGNSGALVALKKIKREQQLFRLADEDRNEQLSAAEFSVFNNPGQTPEMVDLLVHHAFEGDTNGDNKLSYTEQYSGGGALKYSDDIKTRKMFLEEIDHNGDRLMDEQEMRAFMYNPYRTAIRQQAVHLFDTTDTDLDGWMSLEEVMVNWRVFVASARVGGPKPDRTEL